MNLPLTVSAVSEIKTIHTQICSYAKQTLAGAIRCGELLSSARAKIKDGDWLDFVEATLPFSRRTASNYIRIFENRARLNGQQIDATEAFASLRFPDKSESPKALISKESMGSASHDSPANQQVTKSDFSQTQQHPIESGKVAKSINAKPPVELDEIGTPIPSDALPFWHRREEVQKTLTDLSRIKCALEKAKADNDPLYGKVSNAAIADLTKAYTHFLEAKPYAVCTACMGSFSVQPVGCFFCGNKGLISKHQWDTQSRKEIKDIRLKANTMRI